ncbi:MAG: DUF4349 domain-containing protein [Caulobacteraceae bacterium]|nr:DUF4349 domain-containing protein [Caulobacteraceae bacterium]
MQRFLITLAAVSLLGACSNAAPSSEATAGAPAPAAETAMAPARDAAPPSSAAPSDASAPAQPAVSVPMLAYDYSMGVEAPLNRLAGLVDSHEKACADAGPAVCQVIGANTASDGPDGATHASLVIRAQPAWLKAFRARIQKDVGAAGGKLANTSVQAEDLTRAIVDTEAALRAKTTLRSRLEQLLATRNGSLSDLLETERELARVQGEIDATQSELAVMRTRIATSKLTVNYYSPGALAPDSAMRPLDKALHDVSKTVAGGFAAIIYILAALFPFAVVFGPLVWLLARWLRKRKAARVAAQAPPPGPAA